MANIFSRLFKIGESEAHSAMDKLENPIKMTEQGIRDMKKDLDESLHGLAEVKAMVIRSKKEAHEAKNKAADYERKAMLLLQKAEKGEMEAAEADRLATQALTEKENQDANALRSQAEVEKFSKSVASLEQNVKTLRSNLSKWENELKTLKARQKVSSAQTKLNKQLANMDSSSTMSMLERMKDKVEKQEALAESYGEIANEAKSVDEELDQALQGSGNLEAGDRLAALKAKMKNKDS